MIKKLRKLLKLLIIHPILFTKYLIDLNKFRKSQNQQGEKQKIKIFPILKEDGKAGVASGHYFHQDLLIAQRIFVNNPKKHIDIGSRIDGFITHVASFRRIEVFDIRPMVCNIKNIKFIQKDLSKAIKGMHNYSDSISSLHAIEHFGLGRYGDTIDVNGYKKCLNNIYVILKKKGKFYFSVPIGESRIEFNAHRIFSIRELLDIFKNKYQINSFSYVNDEGDLLKNVELTQENIASNFYCNYGCGIFEMTKL